MASLRLPLVFIALLSAVALFANIISPLIGPLEYTGHLTYSYTEGDTPIVKVVFQFNEEIGERLIVVKAPSPWSWTQGGNILSMTGGSLAPGDSLVVAVSFNRYVPPGDRPFTSLGTTSGGESSTAVGTLVVTEMLLLKILYILSLNWLYLFGGTGVLFLAEIILVRRRLEFESSDVDAEIDDWLDRVAFADPSAQGDDEQVDVIEDDDGMGTHPVDDDQQLKHSYICNRKFVRWPKKCDPAPKKGGIKSYLEGEFHYYLWPGSKYRSADGRRRVQYELKRTIDWYAEYCIYLTEKPLEIPESVERAWAQRYEHWYTSLENKIGKGNVGNRTINRDYVNTFRGLMNELQRDALDKGVKLLVVFINEYITFERPTLSSGNTRAQAQIGINWIDSRSKYILAHEFLHAFGKSAPGEPGSFTWGHKSGCPKSMSRVGRRAGARRQNPRQRIDLSGRYLDIREYKEILENKGGNVLKLYHIPRHVRARRM